MDDKQRIALIETRTQGTDGSPVQLMRYQLGNHIGSASLEEDDAGQIISYEEYYPYGSTSYQAVRSQSQTPKRHQHRAKERDDETRLYYYGRRYYASWIGRWASADPASIRDGTNLYVFTRANPIVFIDRDGLDTVASSNVDLRGTKVAMQFEGIVEDRYKYPQNDLSVVRLTHGDSIVGSIITLSQYVLKDCPKESALQAFDRGAATFAAMTNLEQVYNAAIRRGEEASEAMSRAEVHNYGNEHNAPSMTKDEHEQAVETDTERGSCCPK
jgi:RHS repeat-associated protein